MRASFLSVFIAVLALACGSRRDESPIDSIEECSGYVESYRACMSRLGSPEVTDQRVAALRASLEPRSTDRSAREELKKTCIDARAQLATVCR